MRSKIKILGLLLIILLTSCVLRLYKLSEIPPGINIDEASMGYNAYSLLKTGTDRYGQSFPILFRSFGSFQAPLYTYLSILPVKFLGLSVLSVHFVSAISGIVLVLITFLLLLDFPSKGDFKIAALASFLVSISPWAVFFNRIGTEASLGLTLFAAGILVLFWSLKCSWMVVLGTALFGLSTHAYYSERLIGPIFLICFFIIFRAHYLNNKRWLIFALITYFISQIPHIFIANTGALTRRVEQVYYWNQAFFEQNGGSFKEVIFGRYFYIIREFLSQYFAYFSPRSLFFDPDPQGARSMPDLSVFYNWMVVPYLIGWWYLFKKSSPLIKVVLILIGVAPIPASLTRDPFYTLRVLILLWILTILIAFGINELFNWIKYKLMRIVIIIGLVVFSGMSLYVSYFVLWKYERADNHSYAYMVLVDKTAQLPQTKFVVDSYRELGTGIRFAFFKKYDPLQLQQALKVNIQGNYYSNMEFDEPYMLDNVEVRSIDWTTDIYKPQVLVGDNLAISEDQIKEHQLQLLFEIKNLNDQVKLRGYQTDPIAKCRTIIRRVIDPKGFCHDQI